MLCIVCCGLALAFLGAVLTALGVLLRAGTPLKAPCVVAGPTCIVMGFLVLLLSVETIIKCRRAQRFQQSDSKETLLERALNKAAGGKTKDTNVDDAAAASPSKARQQGAPSNSLLLDPQRLVEPLQVEEGAVAT